MTPLRARTAIAFAAKMKIKATAALMLAALVVAPAAAAPKKSEPKKADTAASGPSNAVQGFSQNRDQPVHIEATKLEVRDKDKVATFTGNVQVIQGDTEMRCNTLVVFYEPDSDAKPSGSVAAATPGPGGEQRIKKLEAKGKVVVTQNDQVATGDTALFDMKSNTVTMLGKVVVTQGQNVLRGDRLVVDMTTGTSRVESGENGRVQGLILPGSGSAMPGSPAAKPGANPNARPNAAPSRPLSGPAPQRIY
jgi:lipopolysaccharide export system protein LptA